MAQEMGFRLSKQRKVILEELRKVKSHPTADEVYDMVRKIIPRISLGTVYPQPRVPVVQGVGAQARRSRRTEAL